MSRQRLDILLHEKYPDISRAQLQKFIKSGQVKVNGESVNINKKTINNEDAIELDDVLLKGQNYEQIDLPVIYEDGNLAVIDKPAGLLSHSKGAYNPESTVASWLSARPNFDINSEGNRDGIVHRLDRGTSGVMVAAKNEQTMSLLQKQFSTRKVKKTYIARVTGAVEPKTAIIDLPIERNPKQPQRFRVGHNGKPAKTEYNVIKIVKYNNEVDSIVELKPHTGRTHQLRVHLAYLERPIVGDTFYGGRAASRLYLHATSLELTIPGGKRKIFTSKLPESFYNEKDL